MIDDIKVLILFIYYFCLQDLFQLRISEIVEGCIFIFILTSLQEQILQTTLGITIEKKTIMDFNFYKIYRNLLFYIKIQNLLV